MMAVRKQPNMATLSEHVSWMLDLTDAVRLTMRS